MSMQADAIIEVRFKTTVEGGRSTNISGKFYSCPLFVEGEGFDCRIMLGNKIIQLGETYELPVRFLFRDLAMPRLSIGSSISLWEGKEIATGIVKSVINDRD